LLRGLSPAMIPANDQAGDAIACATESAELFRAAHRDADTALAE